MNADELLNSGVFASSSALLQPSSGGKTLTLTETPPLAVLVGGGGYPCAMPYLYYLTNLFLDAGYACLNLDLDPRRQRVAKLRDGYRREVAAALWKFAQQGGNRVAWWVGKSFGSRVIAEALALKDAGRSDGGESGKGGEGEPRSLLLTPDLRDEAVQRFVRQWGRSILAVMGGADPQFLNAMEQGLGCLLDVCGADMVVLPNADHGLDVAGDFRASLNGLETALSCVAAKMIV